jgi:hypothetical protein
MFDALVKKRLEREKYLAKSLAEDMVADYSERFPDEVLSRFL